MEQTEKVFASGFLFKRNENAPEWVIGSQSIKVDEAIAFLQENQNNGWVNLQVKKSKGGKFYMELDTWEAKPKADSQESFNSQSVDSLPF